MTTDEVIDGQQNGTRPLVCALRSEPFVREWYIPGSDKLPYPSVLNELGQINPQSLTEQWAALELDNGVPPILYCGGGINAAGLALALAATDYPLAELRIYDDSLNGGLSHPALPRAKGLENH